MRSTTGPSVCTKTRWSTDGAFSGGESMAAGLKTGVAAGRTELKPEPEFLEQQEILKSEAAAVWERKVDQSK